MPKKYVSIFILFFLTYMTVSGEIIRYAVFPAPPYMIIGEENGKEVFSGIDVEIVSELAARTGHGVAFVSAPWARCLEMIKAGDADLISSVYRTAEREMFLSYFSKPYLDELPVAFYSFVSDPYTIETYEDLSSVPLIGVLRNASYFRQFDEDKSLRKFGVKNQELLYPMLMAKRISVFAGYVPTEKYFIEHNGYGDRIIQSSFVFSDPNLVFIALSNKGRCLASLAELEAAFNAMLAEGRIGAIIDSYYHDGDN